MPNPQVIISGTTDLFALGLVKSLINLKEEKTFRRRRIITNSYNLKVENEDNFFSVDKPGTQFNNSDWRYQSIQIIDENGNTIWDGVITDIIRNHRNGTAVIQSKNTFFKYRDAIVDYQSDDFETGAEAFKNICDAVGFTKYHQKSYQDSHNVLNDNNCKLKCVYNPEDNVKFITAINDVAKVSNADLYVHEDFLRFVHWVEFSGGVSLHIDGTKKKQVKVAPVVSSPENNLINDYNIDYDGSGGVLATDSANDNLGLVSRNKYGLHSNGASFRTGTGNQIIFENLASAKYIGNGLIRRTNRGDLEKQPRPPQEIKLSIYSDYEEQINLESHFKLTWPDEGWVEKIYEVFSFEVLDDKDEIKITAIEV